MGRKTIPQRELGYVHIVIDMVVRSNTINSKDDDWDGEQEPKHDTDALFQSAHQNRRQGDPETHIQFVELGQPKKRLWFDVMLFLRGIIITWRHLKQTTRAIRDFP